MDYTVLPAFFLTLLAGLSTGIGSCIAFLCRHTNRKFLSVSLGFSAGVMIYVSMIEIFFKAQDALIAEMGTRPGSWATVAAFFGGMLVIAVIDKLIPSSENPHEVKLMEDTEKGAHQPGRLMRMGVFTALAIAIHNFPEGLATFVSALQEPSVAIPIVVAIAIHNIPEGIAVSVPIYHGYRFPAQSVLLLLPFGPGGTSGGFAGVAGAAPDHERHGVWLLFAGVAGIMVFISFDELLPGTRGIREHHLSTYGLISGMGGHGRQPAALFG